MKPATPLPQGINLDASINIGNLYTSPRTVAEWRAKADAYPQLVAALAALVKAQRGGLAADRYAATNAGSDLLRSLGEAA